MKLTIVRHSRAEEKSSWTGSDDERPLSSIGERQAAALAPLLAKYKVRRILSSPALRCVQTVQPLADVVEVPIEIREELARHGHASWIITTCFGDPTFDDTVLCTHGELLQPLLGIEDVRRLARRNKLSRNRMLTKGSAWRLQMTGTGRTSKLDLITPVVHP